MEMLLNLPSAVFVLVPVLCAFISARFTQYGTMLANGIVLQVGLTGTLIGSVQILSNMSDPAALGPAFSIALLTIFYALILSALLTLGSMNLALELPDFRISYSISAGVLWFAITVWAMSTGDSGINAFINIPSIAFVAFSILVIFFFSKFNVEDSLISCAKYLPYAGLIGFFAGVVIILQNMNEPRAIGPAMAVSLLTLLYTNYFSVWIKLSFPRITQGNDSLHWQYLGSSGVLLAIIFSLLLTSFYSL
jgi:hypothetical protein